MGKRWTVQNDQELQDLIPCLKKKKKPENLKAIDHKKMTWMLRVEGIGSAGN